MLTLLLMGAAFAATPVVLPPGESAAVWQEPLAAAGLVVAKTPGAGASVTITIGSTWLIEVRDARGGLRSVTARPPVTEGDREDLAWLISSLLQPASTHGTWPRGLPPPSGIPAPPRPVAERPPARPVPVPAEPPPTERPPPEPTPVAPPPPEPTPVAATAGDPAPEADPVDPVAASSPWGSALPVLSTEPEPVVVDTSPLQVVERVDEVSPPVDATVIPADEPRGAWLSAGAGVLFRPGVDPGPALWMAAGGSMLPGLLAGGSVGVAGPSSLSALGAGRDMDTVELGGTLEIDPDAPVAIGLGLGVSALRFHTEEIEVDWVLRPAGSLSVSGVAHVGDWVLLPTVRMGAETGTIAVAVSGGAPSPLGAWTVRAGLVVRHD